jgi:hypothetical protein
MMKTLSEAMESLVRRGFTEHFGVRGAQLRGFESGKAFGSQDVIIREYDSRVRAGPRAPLLTPLVFTRIRQSARI